MAKTYQIESYICSTCKTTNFGPSAHKDLTDMTNAIINQSHEKQQQQITLKSRKKDSP